MLYPVSVVDGLVHQLGGTRLAFQCKMIHLFKGGCPIGTSVETSPGGEELKQFYDRIIHSTPPFFKNHDDDNDNDNDGDIHNNKTAINSTEILHQCYDSAFKLAFNGNSKNNNMMHHKHQQVDYRVACPLLGAGARGFPQDIAIEVAVNEGQKWLRRKDDDDEANNSIIAFGIPDQHVSDLLVREFTKKEEQDFT